MTGNNNTISITQTQWPNPKDLAGILTSFPEANAEIDAAAARLQADEPDIAIYLLLEIRKKRWDVLKPREKYRICANLGHAMERKGEFREAAKHYIEAHGYQPQDEKARALAAIAYYHLGDSPKAFEVAAEVIRDHPTCSLALQFASVAHRPTCPSETLRRAFLKYFKKKSRFCMRFIGGRLVQETRRQLSDSPVSHVSATRDR